MVLHNSLKVVKENDELVLGDDEQHVDEGVRGLGALAFNEVALLDLGRVIDVVNEVAGEQVAALLLGEDCLSRLLLVELVSELLEESVLLLQGLHECVHQLSQRQLLVELAVVPLEGLNVLHVGDVLLVLVFDFEVFLGDGIAVNADLLVFFARDIELLVELGRTVVDLHQLVQTANFERGLIYLDVVDGGGLSSVMEGAGCLDLVDDVSLALILDLLINLLALACRFEIGRAHV